VRDLYKVVAELELLFAAKNKKFTPDGHLVGSIGEVLAAHMYELDLYPNSHPDHDAVSKDGREVQIKATQGARGVALRSKPQHLIVLRIHQDGKSEEVFNGPGDCVWHACGTVQKNGQRPVSLSTLKRLMSTEVPLLHRLPKIR